MPVTDLIKVQTGAEATWGTCVAATAKLMGVTDASLNVVDDVHQVERSGWYYPSDVVAEVAQMGEGSITLDLTYEDILIPLDNFFDSETPSSTTTTTTTTTTIYTWHYDAPTDTTVDPTLLTIEFGAPDAEYEACGVLFTELNIRGEAGGVWTGTFPFVCQDVFTETTFATLADRDVDLIRMSNTSIAIDPWTGSMGLTTKACTLISFDLNVTSGRHLKTMGGALKPCNWGDTQWTGTLTTVLEFNTHGKAIVDALLTPALVQRQIRIDANNGGAGTTLRRATIDFCGTLVNGVELFSDRDGNITVSLEWQGTYHDTFANWLGVDVHNRVASLP